MPADTIAAIATAPGRGGIGIVRLSGSDALDLARILFRKKNRPRPETSDQNTCPFTSHRFYLGYIIDPASQKKLDEILMVAMHAPKTYTREHVVEFHCHGGELVLKRILEAVLANGARIAEAGEFTKRAFLNGRIDLSQAEAVAELISAGNELALANAIKNLEGKIGDRVKAFLEILTNLLAIIEASIEFPEEVEDAMDPKGLRTSLEDKVLNPIQQLIKDSQEGQPYLQGFFMDIIGRPNVGKSSLLNRLLGKERAIVTAIPGTTRDLVEGSVSLKGIPLHITDTAGIHLTMDPVESIGIEKAKEHIKESDLVLFVLEAHDLDNMEDLHVFQQIGGKPVVVVINKVDLVTEVDFPSPPAYVKNTPVVMVSALSGQGISDLEECITNHFGHRSRFEDDHVVMANLRQRQALQNARQAIESAVDCLDRTMGVDMVAVDIQEAIKQLQYLTGEVWALDIMDHVFERFCIGK